MATAKAAVLPAPAQAKDKLQKAAGAAGSVSAKTEENKQIVKMKKVEAFCKQLLDEWSSLAEDKKRESWQTVAAKLVERVPARFLRLIDMDAANDDDTQQAAASKGKKAEPREAAKAPALVAAPPAKPEAVAPSTAPQVEPSAEEEPWGEDPAQAEEEPFEEEKPAQAEEEEEPFESEHDEASDALQEVRALLKQCQSLPEDRWPTLFKSKLGAQPEVEAIARIFEASMMVKTKPERQLGARVVVELARNSSIQVKSITPALEVAAGKLESLHTEGHDSAWHLLSDVISQMFPRTPSTTWGLLRVGWNWAAWWAMVSKVLATADPYRAFDITVLALQMMQEKSKCKINQQGVWKDGGRLQKLKRMMGDWGQMDEHAVEDVLLTHEIQV